MKVYRIKHIPSGMYYRPARESYHKETGKWIKNNLGVKGKLYPKLPTEWQFKHWFGGSIDRNGEVIPLKDWQVEEV